jgi:hypothetical protein
MNKKSIYIAIILAIICCSFCIGQKITLTPAQELWASKEDIKNSTYIFEGTVIKQKRILDLNYEVYTCNIITITKIYRGGPKLKIGTVKVIIDNGMTEQNGFIVKVEDFEGMEISKNQTYIIFAKATAFKSADSNSVDSIVTDNSITLALADIPVTFIGQSAKWGQTVYKTLDELSAFFKENGLTVQEEVQQK